MGKEKSRGEKQVLAVHERAINCMAMSEDCSLIVTGGDDNKVLLWSISETHTECVGKMIGHSDYITCLSLSGTVVITGSADCTIRKWDMANCECAQVYEGHQSRISKVICTPEYIFSSSYDNTARCWWFDTSTLSSGEDTCIRVFKGHRSGVTPMLFIPSEDTDDCGFQGDVLITGSADHTAISWLLETGGTLQTFRNHKGPIVCMTTNSDATILFTGSADKTIRSWIIARGEPLKVFEEHEGAIMYMSISKGYLYSGCSDGVVRRFNAESGELETIYKGHQLTVTQLIIRRGLIFTVSGDTTARVFDIKSGKERKLYSGHEGAIIGLAMPDKNRFYTASSDGTLRHWDASNVTTDAAYRGSNNE